MAGRSARVNLGMSEQAALSHQEIADRAKRLIAAAAINTEPFPHIVVDEILPDTYYRQILQHLPPQTLLSIPNKFGMMKIGDDDPTFRAITETGRRFWSEFDRTVKASHLSGSATTLSRVCR